MTARRLPLSASNEAIFSKPLTKAPVRTPEKLAVRMLSRNVGLTTTVPQLEGERNRHRSRNRSRQRLEEERLAALALLPKMDILDLQISFGGADHHDLDFVRALDDTQDRERI